MPEEPKKKKRASRRTPPKLQQAIIDDVRAGMLSLKNIAARHGVTYHKVYRIAQKLGGGGDLREEILSTMQDDIVTLRIADNINDAVVVSNNAKIVLALVCDHAGQVSRARNMANLLMDDLESTIRNRVEIEADIEIKCADDQSPMREERLMRAVSLPVNTKTLTDLAGALKVLIGLEREIFDIGKGDEEGKGKTLEDYVMSLPAVN